MTTRVAVFLDYQNVYQGARNAFTLGSGYHGDGQIQPLLLGLALKGVGDPDRELVAVRVYRGRPIWKHDQRGAAACDRQIALWREKPLVTPVTRSLNYRDPSKPREKGIDVCIAIDLVMMGMRDEYDVAVLFSGDTHLLPALEAVVELKSETAVEVAAWAPDDGRAAKPLRVHQVPHAAHMLGRAEYNRVHDPTDYNVRRRRR